jgi:uncharacterized protein
MMSDASLPPQHPAGVSSRWQPLSAIDRRVLGVLAEKAKTTPDIYPMSLNAICTGCNQKSNRDPLMQLEPDDVEESLDRLREMGAVALIEGYGRVCKYRHYLYEWLGVDKVEIAVMIELLLRGEQTVGELRGRASRMEPIADLNALRQLLDSLKSKGLVVSLTSEGRGHVVTHALYKPRELETLRVKYSGVQTAAAADDSSAPARDVGNPNLPAASASTAALHSSSHAGGTPMPPTAVVSGQRESAIDPLRRELEALRTQVAQLQHTVEELQADQRRVSDELRSLKDALGA